MFRTDLLSVIRSINTVFTANDISHTQCSLAWVFLPFVHDVKILIRLVCIVASFKLSCV